MIEANLAGSSQARARRADEGAAPTEQQASDEAFRSVFETAPNGLVLVDESGVIVRTNARLNEMFGYAGDELVGQKIEILVPQRSRAAHPSLRAGFAAAPAARPMGEGRDLTGRRRDGVKIPIEIGLSAFATPRGRMSCASVVDITERKRSELKLREANAQLEEFSYVAAHDLRSPMRGIANLIEMIVEDFGADAPASAMKNLQRMRERVGSVERLIEDLLHYAHAGRRLTKFETIDLASVVNEIIANQSPPPGVCFECDLAVGTFMAVRTPLATVLRNLISNAVKHHDRDEMRIVVRSRGEGEFVTIDVEDDGPGIPAAAQERVFRLFQTLGKSDKTGSGLGLAVVRRLVNVHGGSITLISADGQRGCMFRVRWPRHERSDLDE
jgi:PAS domain S-box-containing protein